MEFRDCDEGAAAKVAGQLAGVTLPIFPISRDFSTWCPWNAAVLTKFKVSERNYIRAEPNTLAGQNLPRIAFPCLKFSSSRCYRGISKRLGRGTPEFEKDGLPREIAQRASFTSFLRMIIIKMKILTNGKVGVGCTSTLPSTLSFLLSCIL